MVTANPPQAAKFAQLGGCHLLNDWGEFFRGGIENSRFCLGGGGTDPGWHLTLPVTTAGWINHTVRFSALKIFWKRISKIPFLWLKLWYTAVQEIQSFSNVSMGKVKTSQLTVELGLSEYGSTNNITILPVRDVERRDRWMMGHLFTDVECFRVVLWVWPHTAECFSDNRVVWLLQTLQQIGQRLYIHTSSSVRKF